MLFNYILDPGIFSVSDFKNNPRDINILKNYIQKENSLLILDKEKNIQSEILSNISEIISENSSIEIVEDTKFLLDFFTKGKNFFEDNKSLKKSGNKINEDNFINFVKNIKNNNKFLDIFIHNMKSKFINNLEVLNYKELFKNQHINNLEKNFKKFRSKKLSEQTEEVIEKNLARVLWNAKEIRIFDQYIANSLKFNPKFFKWEWENSNQFQERYDSLLWIKSIIEKYSAHKNIKIILFSWLGHKIKNLGEEISDPKSRVMQDQQIELFKERISELIPPNSSSITFELQIKVLKNDLKMHPRVMQTDNISVDLGYGIDLIKYKYDKENKTKIKGFAQEYLTLFENFKDIETVKESRDLFIL